MKSELTTTLTKSKIKKYIENNNIIREFSQITNNYGVLHYCDVKYNDMEFWFTEHRAHDNDLLAFNLTFLIDKGLVQTTISFMVRTIKDIEIAFDTYYYYIKRTRREKYE